MKTENFKQLIDAIGTKAEKLGRVRDEDLDFLERALEYLSKYVHSVVVMEYSKALWKERYEGQDYRDKVKDADDTRSRTHDCAIGTVKQVDRLCKMYGVEPVFDVNYDDRRAVARECMRFTKELFDMGQNMA